MDAAVLPILALFAVIVGAFSDFKTGKGRILIYVAIFVALVTCGFEVYQNIGDAREKEASKQNISELLSRVAQLNATLQTVLESVSRGFSSEKLEALRNPKAAATWTASSLVTQSNLADRQFRLIAKQRAGQTANVQIEYFTKDVDSPQIQEALRALGFGFAAKTGKLLTTPTNAIWVGMAVPDSDAKAVALTLIRAGTQLQKLVRLRHLAGAKVRVIQVGGSAVAAGNKPLTVQDVESLPRIPIEP